MKRFVLLFVLLSLFLSAAIAQQPAVIETPFGPIPNPRAQQLPPQGEQQVLQLLQQLQQRDHRLPVLRNIYLQHDLLDLLPVCLVDPRQNVPFALLDVDLQQIDAFDLLLLDDSGGGPKRRRERLRGEPVIQNLIRLFDER